MSREIKTSDLVTNFIQSSICTFNFNFLKETIFLRCYILYIKKRVNSSNTILTIEVLSMLHII